MMFYKSTFQTDRGPLEGEGNAMSQLVRPSVFLFGNYTRLLQHPDSTDQADVSTALIMI